jgi:hypothetical protein
MGIPCQIAKKTKKKQTGYTSQNNFHCKTMLKWNKKLKFVDQIFLQ